MGRGHEAATAAAGGGGAQTLDCDRGGTLSFEEMSEGLRKMNFSPRIALSFDDFERMTHGCKLCDEEGCIEPHRCVRCCSG